MAFASDATNLVTGDTNWETDIFVRDRVAGTTERVSVASDGTEADDSSGQPTISSDGRYVAFISRAANLITGDTNFASDVFVHDRVSGTTERVNVASDEGQSWSGAPLAPWNLAQLSLSGDGRYVAFVSGANDLVAGDTNGSRDVFVRDRVAGTTERVSVASDGSQADAGTDSYGVSISGDGRFVAFQSAASNLAPGWATPSVFVHDRVTGGTERVSVASDGSQADTSSFWPSLSDDGRYVAFESGATNLVAGDTNGTFDIFVHDRVAGGTARVNVASDGSQSSTAADYPSISGDGRYVTFYSTATDLVADDTNGYRDAFVHDAVTGTTERLSIASDGTQSNNSSEPTVGVRTMSANGRYAVFNSFASNLVAGDTNGSDDVFVRDRGAIKHITRLPKELYGHRLNGGYASDPVNTATGNFTQTDTDLDFPQAVFGLGWRRTYNSLDTLSGPMGPGWTSGFDAHVVEEPDGSVTLTDWDGRVVTFLPAAGGGWDRPEEMFADLVRELDDSLSLRFFSGEEWDFDADGRLEMTASWDGQNVTFTYDASSRLTSATSSTGYSLTFTYDPSERISQVASSDGRGVSYSYGANGALATATDAAGGTTTYTTDGAGRITVITDPDGKPVIANTYDSEGRVATQTTPSGDTVTFTYNDETGVTAVAHAAFGAVTSYAHDTQGRLTSITDSYGAILTKAYDSNGNLTSMVDRRG
ncbi:MAG: DUF6531 domain-containing protein, partial [Acidimicrobiia bacterium]